MEKDLYELLGVTKDSTDAEIKKNYRKLAKEFHPDKNPDAGDKFKEISFAYEVLSNPEKRKIYDRHGLSGLQDGAEGFTDASEFFSQWFPFSGQSTSAGRGASSSKRAAQVMVKVEVTLEEIYIGNVIKTVEYKCMEACINCNGQGGPPEALIRCETCGGNGRTANYTFMGLGAFESTCSACYGRGTTVSVELRCITCIGNGLVEVDKSREILVEKGAPNMLQLSFPGEGHQPLTGDRGDLMVVLVQAEHPTFVRRQNDLFLRHMHINLTQALCGFLHCFKHLDGRDICVANRPGEVIRDGEIKMVPTEGMPLRNHPFDRGDLFIQFHVDFPENNFMPMETLQKLETLLPPREPVSIPPDAEEVHMTDMPGLGDSEGAGAHGGGEDDEDYDGDGPQYFESVQCQSS